MGIFDRLKNLAKGKINGALDDIENPIELCDQHIRDMEEKYRQAEMSSATVIGNARGIENDVTKTQADLQDMEDKIKLAVSKGNDELAKKAIVRKGEIASKLESLKKSAVIAHDQAEKLKTTLTEIKDEIETTRQKRDELEARFKTAEASQSVNEIMANVSSKDSDINMDDLERRIAKKEATAEGLGEIASLKKNNLDDEFKKLGSSVDVDAELAKYKQS